MKIVSIVGARPNFIKVAPIVRAIEKIKEEKIEHIIVHTGQHYDYLMNKIFFDELQIPEPKYNLEVGSGTHAEQVGKILIRCEDALGKEKPDFVLVYGDTNSTLGGALSAIKLKIPVGHIEAGLRCGDMYMPEEINRVIVDRISHLLFAPTRLAVQNLKREGIRECRYNKKVGKEFENQCVIFTGDVMFDLFQISVKISEKSEILEKYNLKPREYYVATIHREENTKEEVLKEIFDALSEISKDKKIVVPLHPRTRRVLTLEEKGNFLFLDPIGYFDMIKLVKNSGMVFTDSGGLQKEALWLKIPTITLRDKTEWKETLGLNILAGTKKDKILKAYKKQIKKIEREKNEEEKDEKNKEIFGNNASEKIVRTIIEFNKWRRKR